MGLITGLGEVPAPTAHKSATSGYSRSGGRDLPQHRGHDLAHEDRGFGAEVAPPALRATPAIAVRAAPSVDRGPSACHPPQRRGPAPDRFYAEPL